ncbi:MOP flippase family protein [Aureimonas sp. ME7]|uniref:MOP flippase family protein n=1 Tax=Aureimonas sp. ME7 TaxID=2744252 RepID=UPI0015FA2EE6|nr:MOP flippase family protein [Aureimonas sp. ME7]
MRAEAFSAVRWTSFVTIARVVLQTLQLMVLARLVAPADFGLMAMIVSITAFIQLFADLGVSNSIIHARQISHEVLSTLYWLNVAVGAALSLAIWLASPAAADFYGEPALVTPLSLAGLSFFLLAIGQQVKVLAEKRLAFRSVALVEMTSAVVSTIVAIVAAYQGAGVYALVLAVLTLTGGNSILYFLFVRDGWLPGFHLRFREASSHLKAGAFLLGTSLANTFAMQSDVIIIGRILGSAALGAYTVPRELCLKVMMATNPIMTRVGTPLMAKAQDDPDMLRRIYLATIRMTSSVNFPIYAAMATFRHEITLVVFGPQWAGSADLLGILAVWGMFRSLGNPVGSLLYATGNAKLALVQSLSVAVALSLVIAFSASFGLWVAASAMTLFYVLFVFALWAFVLRRIIDVGLWDYTKQWLVPLAITVPTSLAAYGAAMAVEPAILRLAVGLAAGGAIYTMTSFLCNRVWFTAMMQLARRT